MQPDEHHGWCKGCSCVGRSRGREVAPAFIYLEHISRPCPKDAASVPKAKVKSLPLPEGTVSPSFPPPWLCVPKQTLTPGGNTTRQLRAEGTVQSVPAASHENDPLGTRYLSVSRKREGRTSSSAAPRTSARDETRL